MTKEREHILQSIAVATAILLVSLVACVLPAHASMIFPSDAKSIHYEQLANGNTLALATSTSRTILSVQFDGAGSPQMGLWCGGVNNHVDTVNDIYETHISGIITDVFMEYHCDGQPLTTSMVSGAAPWGHYFITYVDRDTRTTRDPMELGQSVATSTFVNGSFSATTTATIANSSSTPFYTQDAGNVLFLLTILISLMFLMVVGFVYNNMTNKKPWH